MDSEKRLLIDRIEWIVCQYFDVCPEDILDKGHKTEQSLAKGMLWYILHKDYKISSNALARVYFRTQRSLLMHIAKTTSCIQTNKRYKTYYKEIREILDKELPLD